MKTRDLNIPYSLISTEFIHTLFALSAYRENIMRKFVCHFRLQM